MYQKLFTPKKINQCEIPNRLVVTAMVTNFCDDEGKATERWIRYHEEKAKGGWGLIITEDFAINRNAKGYSRIAGLYNDEQIPSHKKLVDTVHQYDSKIFAQIYHPGRQTTPERNGNVQPIAPSAIPCLALRVLPREVTRDEIAELVEQFGDTALRAKKAGFDGVEIHGGHGYLLTEFMSPVTNKRTDEYGGTFENRTRILHEIIDNIRGKVGRDYPVIIRISAAEGTEGAKSFIESLALARLIEEWGFDGINVSSSIYGSEQDPAANMYEEEGWVTELAEKIKKLVSIPIICANRLTDPLITDAVLLADRCDFIGMGRQSLADPLMPNKAKAGDSIGIRRCIGCSQGCFGNLEADTPISCLVNPGLGLEYENHEKTVDQPKKVAVIGGGIAGMEAAIFAAKRGHKVSLFEAGEILGGQWIAAAYPLCKAPLASFTVWQKGQLEKYNVDVHLNTSVSEQFIRNISADSIILATGGKPIIPAIEGADRQNVHLAEDALLGKVELDGTVIVCGGGEIGCETAGLIAQRVEKVKIIEMKHSLMEGDSKDPGVVASNALQLLPILEKYQVEAYTDTILVKITDCGIEASCNGTDVAIPGDHIILALGYYSNNPLEEIANKYCTEVLVVGNAKEASDGLAAVRDGYQAGCAV